MTDPTLTPTSVYRYYDTHDILIYVGITSRGVKRNVEHNTTKDWWQFVVRQDVEHFPNRVAALAHEKALIQKHSPPFNVQHNRGADQIRAAYLLFVVATGQPEKIRDSVRAMQGRLELDAHTLGGSETVVLRTRLDDANVVAAMQLPEGEMPQVFGLKNKGVSRLRSLQKRGPFGLLHLGAQWRHPIRGAHAQVKFDNKGNLYLRNVHVLLDHGDGSQCGKRCPQHLQNRPRTQWIRPDGAGAA